MKVTVKKLAAVIAQATDDERRRCLKAVKDEPEYVEHSELHGVRMCLRAAKDNIRERIKEGAE